MIVNKELKIVFNMCNKIQQLVALTTSIIVILKVHLCTKLYTPKGMQWC